MNKKGIDLARQWLDLPESVTDEEIGEGLRGSSIETRIEFHLARKEFTSALHGLLVQPFYDLHGRLTSNHKE